MAVSRRLRFEILRRDNHACRYCGATAPDVKLTVDHVTPVALGGDDKPSNLVTACDACNGGKTSTNPDAPVVADVAQDALRWSAALQRAAALMLVDLDHCHAAREEFAERWESWGIGKGENRQPLPRPAGWRQSIDGFVVASLPMEILLDCVDMAMGNQKVKAEDTFRYMCGIAWRKVTELQEAARGLVGTSDGETEEEEDYEHQGFAYGALDLLDERERDLYLKRAFAASVKDEELFNSALTFALVQIQEDRRDLAKMLLALRKSVPDGHPVDWIAPDGLSLDVVSIMLRAFRKSTSQETSA